MMHRFVDATVFTGRWPFAWTRTRRCHALLLTLLLGTAFAKPLNAQRIRDARVGMRVRVWHTSPHLRDSLRGNPRCAVSRFAPPPTRFVR